MDELGVNPEVHVFLADDPEKVRKPNFIQKVSGKKYSLDGIAYNDNSIEIYIGKWQDGRFIPWTQKYFKWLFTHECCHQKYFYLEGHEGDPWKGLSYNARVPREERACNRTANKLVGVPRKDFAIYLY